MISMKAVCVISLLFVAVAVLGGADALACNSCACLNASRTEHCVYGTCRMSRGTAICICDTGYRGNRCQDRIAAAIVSNPCQPNPCQDNGYCSSSNGGYMCQCSNGFTGLNCQYQDSSYSDPCRDNVCAANERCVPWNIGNNYWCLPQ